MESEKQQSGGFGKAVFEHAVGTTILGATLAGIGAGVALSKGRPIGPEATAYGFLGTLSGLGFGRTLYQGLFSASSSRNGSWQDRVANDKATEASQRGK